MALTFTAVLTRTQLGLGNLNIHDGTNYLVSGEILGGQTSWRRQTVKSPYVESEFTVNRVRGLVEERFAVEVLGSTQVAMATNVQTLINAISQDTFNLSMTLDSQAYTYACEASDYAMDWSIPRMHGRRTQMKITLRRSPVPINGV